MISAMREADLVRSSLPFIPTMLQSLARRCFTLDTEVGVGSNIADVVVLLADEKIEHPSERLTLQEAVILSQLRRHGATRIDLLEKRCRIPRGGLRNGVLSRVAECGLVTLDTGGRIELANGPYSSFTIVAIEAKLRRWKEALNQAVGYKRFADYSYVLLPASSAGQALKNRQEFENAGVGLWVFEDCELTCPLEATQSDNHCWRREFVISRMAKLEKQSCIEHIANNRPNQSGTAS